MPLGYLARKALRALLTLWLVVTFVFVVLRLTGDPVQALLGPDALPEVVAAYAARYGFDQPLPVQYARYLLALLSGDLGFSYLDGRPVGAVIAERLPFTLQLGALSLTAGVALGTGLGILAALNRNRLADRLTMAFAVFGFAIPNFFFGILLILWFSLSWRLLPSAGHGTLAHLVMPVATLATAVAGTFARFTRSAMLEVLGRPYMQAAAARGVPFGRRVLRHALPNAAIPMVTILGFSLGGLIAGSIVTETVFAWPGVGRLLVTSVGARDLAVVQALVVMIAATMIVANLAVDLLYGLIDPRIRVGGGA
jgi:peptide/nickel transport system permease protein